MSPKTYLDLPPERILTNDVTFAWEYNPHNIRLWLIGNEYGPIVALWAGNEQDSLDEMLDKGFEHFLVKDPEPDPEGTRYTYLGNAGEPCDLTYAWLKPILVEEMGPELAVKLAQAREQNLDNLGEL